MEGNEDFFPTISEDELKDGSMKFVSIEGTPILFIKLKSKIFVIDNRCPHQGCGFSGGTLDGDVIVCPCHDWRFNLKTGEYEDVPSLMLKKYEFKIEDGKIWVKLED